MSRVQRLTVVLVLNLAVVAGLVAVGVSARRGRGGRAKTRYQPIKAAMTSRT